MSTTDGAPNQVPSTGPRDDYMSRFGSPVKAPLTNRLARPDDGRLVAGVAVGLARHLGVSPIVIRATFVVVSLVNGIGVVAYVVLWALMPQAQSRDVREALNQLRAGYRHGRPATAERARQALTELGPKDQRVKTLLIGVACIAAAALLIASRFTDLIRLSVIVPVGVVLVGAALGLGQLDRSERAQWLGPGQPVAGAVRLAGGLLLVIAGVVLLVAPSLSPAALVTMAVAIIAVLAGTALVLWPWARQVLTRLEEERGMRVRQDERAEIAAHLHDSVLQTLALIQRRAHDGDTVARLARAQERQLREYLYGAGGSTVEEASVRGAVRRVAAEVEDEFGVPVEVVTVGDASTTVATSALVQALREALLNAVRHGKVGVDVYLECLADGALEAFVRDRGPGFDLAMVPTDRLGVRESVIGRMQRAGGSATVRRAPGGGTEVALRLPAAATPTTNGRE